MYKYPTLYSDTSAYEYVCFSISYNLWSQINELIHLSSHKQDVKFASHDNEKTEDSLKGTSENWRQVDNIMAANHL